MAWKCAALILNHWLQENPDMYAAIRHALDECGQPSGWRWLDSVDELLAGKGVKYMALVTQAQKDQEAATNQCCFALAL